VRPARIDALLEATKDAPFSYREVGATAGAAPYGWDTDRHRIRLGRGEETYERACEAIRAWKMFDLGWVRTHDPGASIEVGRSVAVIARYLGMTFVNLCRIVRVIDEDDTVSRQFGFAYGTLDHHAERGEERFLVEWDRGDDAVWFEIFAFSRPKQVLARLGYPITRAAQRRFARDSAQRMLRAVGTPDDGAVLERERSSGRENLRWAALMGLLVWIISAGVLRPHPLDGAWAIGFLILAVTVVVPTVLRLVARREDGGRHPLVWRLAAWLQLPAAVLLTLSFAEPPGPIAAAMSLPWLAVTGLVALFGFGRLLRRGLFPLHELAVDAGLMMLALGGAWTTIYRFGARPLEFPDAIVLLTAIHFHFAALALPVMTGLAARALPSRISQAACVGVIVGVPLTALGITATQMGIDPMVETAAACLTAVGGMLAAVLHGRLALRREQPGPVRLLWGLAAAALAFAMVLAVLYGLRFIHPISWINVPWMRALHGSANALGFTLLGLWAWSLAVERPGTGALYPATP